MNEYDIAYRLEYAGKGWNTSLPLNPCEYPFNLRERSPEMTDERAIAVATTLMRSYSYDNLCATAWLVAKYWFPIDSEGMRQRAIKREVIAQSETKSERLNYESNN